MANGDGTVTDNLTGLMWEMQTTICGGEVTCYTNMYSWTSTSTGSLADGTLWTVFVPGLNGGDYYSPSQGMDVSAGPVSCFANHCDWRIPTIAELISIVERSAPGCGTAADSPCIDPAFGPIAGLYWSSSSSVGSPVGAWSLVYVFVIPDEFVGKPNSLSARAVRSGR
ncbi:MAG: adhesin [Gammaproteobacteria bacterium]|nr:adhesin [Gammaproteobacteria bacterium]